MSEHHNGLCEAIIIGGGQAGLATAYYLLRAGVKALVLDDHESPRVWWRL